MAEVNKEKDEFKKKYKEFKNEVLAPLTPLDAKAKEIEGFYDSARAALDNQVKNFEKGKLEAIKVIVEKYRDDACLDANITPESIVVTDLVILSAVNVNSKGYSIAKKTSDTIDQRIAKRDREIADNARKEAEERARVREAELLAKAEREKQEALLKAEREKAEAVAKATRADITPVQEEVKEPTFTDDGKRIFTVTATFEVSAPKQTTIDKIINKLQGMIEGAGITSLKKIEVR